MGYRWARTAVEAVDAVEHAQQELEAEYGEIRDFTPPNYGRIVADRMEVFLAVRESITPQREDLAVAVAALAPTTGEGGAVGGLRAARAGMSLAPRVLQFAGARNTALLDAGMGPGEYAWIYWLSYDAWLGHPPGESVLDDIMEARSTSDGAVQMRVDGMSTGEVRRQLRTEIVAMLQNLDRALADDPNAVTLHEMVTTELAAVANEPERFPWQDGAPDALTAGLEPYRDRLEATYSTAVNPFELIELN
jgi:hypothetical protein